MAKSDEPPHGKKMPQRCGAHAKQTGLPCRRYPMANGRCMMHGGKSTGAKVPHRPITHGRRTREAIAERKAAQELMRRSRELLKELE